MVIGVGALALYGAYSMVCCVKDKAKMLTNVFKMKTKDSNEEIKVYDYEFTFREKTFNVHYIFDVNGTADKETEEIYKKVKLACPDKSELILTYMAMLIYADKPADEDAFNARVSYYSAFTEAKLEETLNAFVDVVTEALVKGEKVQLVGFGSFETRKRAARKGRNPQTKEEIKIPASKAPVFKAGKALKDLVNG